MLDAQQTERTVADLIRALDLSEEDARTIAHDVAEHGLAAYASNQSRPQDPQVIALAGALVALAPGYEGNTVNLMIGALMVLREETCDCADQVALIYDTCGRHG